MKRIVLVILSLIFLGQTQAWAAEWYLDPDHTGFLFEVKHTYATVRGQFDDFDGGVLVGVERILGVIDGTYTPIETTDEMPPFWLMNSSAMSSSSPVEIPALTCGTRKSPVRSISLATWP